MQTSTKKRFNESDDYQRPGNTRNFSKPSVFLRFKAFRYVILSQIMFMFLVVLNNIINVHKSFNSVVSPIASSIVLQHAPDFLIRRRVCDSIFNLLNDADNFAFVRKAYQDLNRFHNEGGNLAAISKYLTDNIDSTFQIHGMTFIPQYASNEKSVIATSSISTAVKEALASNDKEMRGGYDQRQLPGKIVNNNNKLLHKGRTITVLEPWDGTRWEIGLGPISPNVCKSVDKIKAKSNKDSYDDKFMCSYNSLVVNKKTSTHTPNDDDSKQQCDIISIGSNGQWGFEQNINDNTNCITHTFDCTVKDPKKPSSDSIKFYPYCISDKNEMIGDRQYMTYSKMIESVGMTQPPALFKIDVEGFEFDVFRNMLEDAVQSNTMDMLPMQISVELHYATRMYDVPWMMRSFTTSEIAMFVGMMYRRGGYVLVNHEPIGPGCWACAEVLFVKLFCDE